MAHFKFIEHTADIGIEVTADLINDLFIFSASAICEISLENFETTNNIFTENFTISSNSLEELLIDFLSEINFNIVTRKKILVTVEDIFIIQNHDGYELLAKLIYEKFNPEKHIIQREIKAVTYHQLKIEEVEKKYKTKIIFDT
ncbi:MAG: archease [Ignavibacteriales bacterium]|nr:archease [Ignavibacteriales bacterium]